MVLVTAGGQFQQLPGAEGMGVELRAGCGRRICVAEPGLPHDHALRVLLRGAICTEPGLL